MMSQTDRSSAFNLHNAIYHSILHDIMDRFGNKDKKLYFIQYLHLFKNKVLHQT